MMTHQQLHTSNAKREKEKNSQAVKTFPTSIEDEEMDHTIDVPGAKLPVLAPCGVSKALYCLAPCASPFPAMLSLTTFHHLLSHWSAAAPPMSEA
eukprot:1161726-Pelagomonas_calceolata.AAC.15